MSGGDPDDAIYAAPASPVADVSERRSATRFWMTCVVCGVALSVTGFLVFAFGLPARPSLTTTFALFAAAWLLPVIWILLPVLRGRTSGGISKLRFLSIFFGFPIAALAISVLVVLVFAACSLVVVALTHPELL